MSKPAVTAMTFVTFLLGATLAVLVTGAASAASPKTTKTTTTTTKTTTGTPATPMTTTAASPADLFSVLNATVNAASDHEIVGSSAFPNFAKGAVDNYYSLSRAHVDNSPFAEGTASPGDTGPIGQTAAAGNFQQSQYADARWPGNPDKASFGNKGGPSADAAASDYRATAEASEATNGLSAPTAAGAKTLPAPAGFNGRLRQALATWKAKWQGRLDPKAPAPAVTTPVGTVTVPKPAATTPTATVTTPIATVTTPTLSNVIPTPTVTTPTLPSAGAGGGLRPQASQPASPRSLTSASTPPDGESLLSSSTTAALVGDKNKAALVTSGESSLGRVSLGGGQIVIEGIHVTASITNDGTPTYKAAVSVASASIGGVPVTIDQDGVHVAGQGQGLPYQQASDALNGALKQAGIQLFLVAPEVTKNTDDASSCGQTDTGSMPPIPTTAPTPGAPSSSSDQSGTTSSCDQGGSCTQSATATTTTTKDQSSTSSCDQSGPPDACAPTGTTSTGNTTTSPLPGIGTTPTTKTTTTTTTKDQTPTSGTPGSCDQPGTTPVTTPCGKSGTATGTTTSANDQPGTTSTASLGSPLDAGSTNAGSQKVTATGVHLVFTQPVNQSGVPAQYIEHILGEVSVDSLASPAVPAPSLDLSSPRSSSSSPASSAKCGAGSHVGSSAASTSGSSSATAGGPTTGGGSAVGGSTPSSSSLTSSPSAAGFGSTAQPAASATPAGNSLPASFAAALKKPLWLLLAYLVWQALVVATGLSLWKWNRGETT